MTGSDWGWLLGIGAAGVTFAALRSASAARRKAVACTRELAHLKDVVLLKDEYVAKVSHDLRTPLTAIKEGIALVLDEALGPINADQKDFLKTADESIDRLTELINTVLDLSKIEAGRLRLSRRRLAIAGLVETMLSSYRMVAGERRIEIEKEDVPDVFADSNRIIQVLGNLFSNAVKFTAADGVIRFRVRRDGESSVAVCVSDNGSGIAAADLPKLFQKFSQVGAGQTKPRSTGLGLALCKELIELHQGSITAASELGKGTTFTFMLPVHTAEFALKESFRELVDFAARIQQSTVGVLVLALVVGKQNENGSSSAVKQAAEFVRMRIEQGDIVIPYGHDQVIVLALTDAPGLKAMSERLQQLGRKESPIPFHCSAVLYPKDGQDIEGLVHKALIAEAPVVQNR